MGDGGRASVPDLCARKTDNFIAVAQVDAAVAAACEMF